MKIVAAIIRSEQLPAVKQALFDVEFRNITASAVMGTAPQSEQRMFRGVKREVSLFPRVRLEIAVTEDQVESAIKAISKGARETGGWGRIMVTPLDKMVTIWKDEYATQDS